MKKVSLLIICLILTILPCNAKSSNDKNLEKDDAPKVFVYHIPDEDEGQEDSVGQVEGEQSVIVSDDITEDTSPKSDQEELSDDDIEADYEISDMYSDVLYGYTSYDEDEDAISLEDDIKDFQELNIKTPSRVESIKFGNFPQVLTLNNNNFSKFSNLEYNIKELNYDVSEKIGSFSTGTQYEQKITYGEVRQSTSLYSRYDMKYGAFNTEFSKTVNSTNGDYNDYFSFAPEVKLGRYFSLKETLSANFAKNIKIAEFVLSIKPFAKYDVDRFTIDLGTSSVFDENNSIVKNRFKIDTKFRL
ncbi:MAG: hypothetical protein NC191_05330 [Muribaculaceae bacterium]|nr:hypothetical protein [Muribaculaceae bacterium]